jgi:hypothetical protein
MKRPNLDPNTVIALVGLVALAVGLCIGLPPVALIGPGAAFAVSGSLLMIYAVLPDRSGGTPQ